jgi:hypothetical protein
MCRAEITQEECKKVKHTFSLITHRREVDAKQRKQEKEAMERQHLKRKQLERQTRLKQEKEERDKREEAHVFGLAGEAQRQAEEVAKMVQLKKDQAAARILLQKKHDQEKAEKNKLLKAEQTEAKRKMQVKRDQEKSKQKKLSKAKRKEAKQKEAKRKEAKRKEKLQLELKRKRTLLEKSEDEKKQQRLNQLTPAKEMSEIMKLLHSQVKNPFIYPFWAIIAILCFIGYGLQLCSVDFLYFGIVVTTLLAIKGWSSYKKNCRRRLNKRGVCVGDLCINLDGNHYVRDPKTKLMRKLKPKDLNRVVYSKSKLNTKTTLECVCLITVVELPHGGKVWEGFTCSLPENQIKTIEIFSINDSMFGSACGESWLTERKDKRILVGDIIAMAMVRFTIKHTQHTAKMAGLDGVIKVIWSDKNKRLGVMGAGSEDGVGFRLIRHFAPGRGTAFIMGSYTQSELNKTITTVEMVETMATVEGTAGTTVMGIMGTMAMVVKVAMVVMVVMVVVMAVVLDSVLESGNRPGVIGVVMAVVKNCKQKFYEQKIEELQ